MKNGFLTAAETLNGVYTIGSVTLVAFAAAGAVAAPWTMAGVMVLGSLSYVADEYIDYAEGKEAFEEFIAAFAWLNWLVDPSGYVYEAVPSNRLSDAKTTIYMQDSENGQISVWDASEYDQENPLYSDIDGLYAWDVPEGSWQVQFEKEGYETAYSEWLPVPPPQTEVNVGLITKKAPSVSYSNAYPEGIEIQFDQYMDLSTVIEKNLVISNKGNTVDGIIHPLDAEWNYDHTAQYAKTFEYHSSSPLSGSVEVTVSGVKNYAGLVMEKDYSFNSNVIAKIESFTAPATETADYRTQKSILLQAYPEEAAAGQTVTVTMDNHYIAAAQEEILTFDQNGQAVLELTTLLPGKVDISFEIKDSVLKANTALMVSTEKGTTEEKTATLKCSQSTDHSKTVVLTNTSKDVMNVQFILASYDVNGKMVDISAMTQVLNPSDSVDQTLDFESKNNIAYVKAFALDAATHVSVAPACQYVV